MININPMRLRTMGSYLLKMSMIAQFCHSSFNIIDDTIIKYDYDKDLISIININGGFSIDKIAPIYKYNKDHQPIIIIISVSLQRISTLYSDFKYLSQEINGFIPRTTQETNLVTTYYEFICKNI